MKVNNAILQGYENYKIRRYDDLDFLSKNTIYYDELSNNKVSGVIKSCHYVNDKLALTFSNNDSHVAVIAATGLGKTTGYVIPTLNVFAKMKEKKSMIISDPKGELYSATSKLLKDEGYNVLLFNTRDYKNSECYNLITKILRKYKTIDKIYENIKAICENGVYKSVFEDKVYDSQEELSDAISRKTNMILDEVGNQIDDIAEMFIDVYNEKDKYWDESAKDVFKAMLWAMLEDSNKKDNPITEETFSFNTMLEIVNTFNDGTSSRYNDGGYFTDRDESSMALKLMKHNVIENADTTRKCIMSTFNSKMSVFKEVAIRTITSCNTFEFDDLLKRPTAIFINYKDELKVHYKLISLFVKDAYTFLIDKANKSKDRKLDIPFYFILDEFGNFPALKDFDTTISACRGRNIYFMLIIQSYAQLSNVYGDKVSEIIRDNLNVHVFFGSNNPNTLKEFSEECGKITRISPLSALNGNTSEIENNHLETIPAMPISELSCLKEGECIVTEANSGYVLKSKLERSYKIKEFSNYEKADIHEYKCPVDLFDKKYRYKVEVKPKKRNNFFD